MKTYFTADLHMGHTKILEYMDRPFKTLDEMHTFIVDLWNKTVKPEDTVHVLGDFGINPKYSTQFLPFLNGHLHLTLGNHDNQSYYHSYSEKAKRKSDRIMEQLFKDGWKSIELHRELILSNGRRVLLSHTPYYNADTAEYDARYLNFRPKDKGLFLLHGHLHKFYLKKKNMIDVGIDGELKIWSEDEIISLINDEREFIPSITTKTNHAVKGDDK